MSREMSFDSYISSSTNILTVFIYHSDMFAGVVMKNTVGALVIITTLISCTLCAQHHTLEVTEVNSFAFAHHDGGGYRHPYIQYPYVYLPDTYGLQVCLWDSTANTFTRLANLGLPGRTWDIAGEGDNLYLAVDYSESRTTVTPDMPKLFRLDISDPANPVVTNTVVAGEDNVSYSHLEWYNDVLLAAREEAGTMTGLVLFDPETLEVLYEYPTYYHYSILQGGYLITRAMNETPFRLFTVNAETGLTFYNYLNLPYATNIFPAFTNLDETHVTFQLSDTIDIWDCSDITDWQLLSTIENGSTFPAVLCGGYLVFHKFNITAMERLLYVYNVQSPAYPVLMNTQEFPVETTNFIGSYFRIFGYDNYLFVQGGAQGFFNLKMLESGLLEYGASCYEYNGIIAPGRKCGNHLLLPTAWSGLVCFDVSDPYNPSEDFRLFDGNCMSIDTNGTLLYANMYESDENNTHTERIYDITDLQNPLLVFSEEPTYDISIFFNPEEQDTFYKFDFTNLHFLKYQVQNGAAECLWSWPVTDVLVTPVFSDGLVYCLGDYANTARDLYVFEGFPENEPALQEIVEDEATAGSSLFRAGAYAFLRDLDVDSPPATFMRNGESFTVQNGSYGFAGEDFAGVDHDTFVSFYDITTPHSGFREPDTVLSEYCPTAYIEWDYPYMYLFTSSNIKVYSYEIVGITDKEQTSTTLVLSVHPNPFNPQTTIGYSLVTPAHVSIGVYNIRGQLVKTLVNDAQDAGEHTVCWNGRDNAGRTCSGGVYLCRLNTAGATVTKKMLLLK